MKKKYLLFFVFIFLYSKINSQNIYKKYYLTYVLDYFSLNEISNNNFIIGLRGMSIIDGNGNVISQTNYIYPPINIAACFYKIPNNRYIFHGGIYDTCNAAATVYPV